MNGYQLSSIRKGRLYLYIVNHLGNAVHTLVSRNHMRAGFHQVSHRFAVTRTFNNKVGDQRHRLGVIQLHPTRQPFARDHGRNTDKKLVLFSWCQFHVLTS